MTNKIAITQADVFDGTRFIGTKNIFIENGFIVDVSIAPPQGQSIDGAGLIVSPGFIDVHTHADLSVVFADSSPFLSQGVTTLITGNCGISAGVHNKQYEDIINHEQWNHPEWKSWSEYYAWVGKQKTTLLHRGLVGYHSLIEESIQTGQSPVSLLARFLGEGAIGLSFGLEYGHGRKLDTLDPAKELLIELSRRGAVVAVHLKDQGGGLYDAVSQFTDLFTEKATEGVTIEISHLKHKLYLDPEGTHTVKKTLTLIEEWRKRGYAIACDAYPYTGGATVLKKESVRQCKNGWADIYPFGYSGSIDLLSKERGVAPELFVDDLLKKNPNQLTVYQNIMSEDEVNEIVSQPFCFIGSDALPSHPRATGTFPKLIRQYSGNKEKLTDLLYRMTAGAAQHFHLPQKHVIRKGEPATLCLFDPQTITPTSTYQEPKLLSEGIRAVFVNGTLVYQRDVKTSS